MDPVKKRARAPPTARGKHAVCAIKLIGMTSLLLSESDVFHSALPSRLSRDPNGGNKS